VSTPALDTAPRAIALRQDLDAVVTIPGSKSCTARALTLAALTVDRSILHHPADCDDTDHMLNGLRAFGIPWRREGDAIMVDGRPFTAPAEPVFLGNSGTAVRFLAAACAHIKGSVTLDGTARMRERPIQDLVDALNLWGVKASAPTGCPPITIASEGHFGGITKVKGSASSQYLSGLLMASPMGYDAVAIEVEGELVSKPYIDLTLAMMAERGVRVKQEDYNRFLVPPRRFYEGGEYTIEADASGASYFLAAAAIAGGRVRVANLSPKSAQGDARFAFVLEQMGCHVQHSDEWTEVHRNGALEGIEIDLNAMPDMVQTLAAVALFAEGPTTIRNVANLRIKETDRIAAMAVELRKLGAAVEEFDDGLRISPARQYHGAALDTYDDHRMAMSLSLAGLRVPGVVINDPYVVSKTFPDFFERFAQL